MMSVSGPTYISVVLIAVKEQVPTSPSDCDSHNLHLHKSKGEYIINSNHTT